MLNVELKIEFRFVLELRHEVNKSLAKIIDVSDEAINLL